MFALLLAAMLGELITTHIVSHFKTLVSYLISVPLQGRAAAAKRVVSEVLVGVDSLDMTVG